MCDDTKVNLAEAEDRGERARLVDIPPRAVRESEAGDDGLEIVAFGAHSDDEQPHMQQDFWPQ